MDIIKAQRSVVKFSETVFVDGYLLPDGEFRVGKVGASLSLGYESNWVTRISGKVLKALQEEGFTGLQKVINLDAVRGGGTKAKTLSLKDYRTLIMYAASQGKPQAVAMANALIDTSLEDFFRLSFDQSPMTRTERMGMFDRSYIESINWKEEDEMDWEMIEEQENFLAFGE